jgi:hypothetical protein
MEMVLFAERRSELQFARIMICSAAGNVSNMRKRGV